MSLEDLLALNAQTTAVKKEAPFQSYTVYLNEHYVGNFSVPENFTPSTKEAVLSAMKTLGLELRAPGSTKKEISISDLLPSA